MNLAHVSDLLLMEEWTVIDERCDLFCPVFSLPLIESADLRLIGYPPEASITTVFPTVGREYFFSGRKLPLKMAV
jgi:hypothetical protein